MHDHIYERGEEVKAHDEAVNGMVGQLEVCACGHNRCMHRGVQGHAQCTQKSCRCYLFRNPAPDPLSCGASDGEMGDENWVYEYTCDHLAVSVPSKHDPLWSVAWSNGERIGEGASQPLMWADARHRLTSEAAAEYEDDNSESWHNRAGDRMAQAIANLVHLGRIDSRSEASDAMLDYMGKKGVPAPTVTRVFSPAPALKAQEGVDRDHIGRCTTCQRVDCMCKDNAWLRTRLKQTIDHWDAAKASLVDYSNPAICIHCGGVIRKGHTEWFHFDGWFRESRFCEHGGKMAEPPADFASLAKKLASAIEHAVWQLDETDTNPGDACDDLRTVLTEAKKAGCA